MNKYEKELGSESHLYGQMYLRYGIHDFALFIFGRVIGYVEESLT